MMQSFSSRIIRISQRLLEKLGIRIIRCSEYYWYKDQLGEFTSFKRWARAGEFPTLQDWVFTNFESSNAQIQQDLIASFLFPEPGNYFVEFGATDGVSLSNTCLLEAKFGWTGLLSEPGLKWQEDLVKNRKCAIDFRAVAGVSGEKRFFIEAFEGEYSTLADFSNIGTHTHVRDSGIEYLVETVSLNDLLEEHKAPKDIQMMSIDTEGSELEILSKFDFDKHRIAFFVIEHNYTQNEKQIDELLMKNGYFRFLREVSEFDAWYIHTSKSALLR